MGTDKRHSAPVWPPAQSEGALDARRHHAQRRADENRIELREPRGQVKWASSPAAAVFICETG